MNFDEEFYNEKKKLIFKSKATALNIYESKLGKILG